MSARTWIGLDPSLAAFGWAVMRHEVGGQPYAVAIGTWRTKIDGDVKKLENRARRVRELIVSMRDLVVEYRPTEAYVESAALVHGRQNFHSISAAGRVRGIVDTCGVLLGFEVAEVQPHVLKKAITGRADASKEEVASMVGQLYYGPSGRFWGKKELDATDALAVAHVGAYRYGHGVTVSSGVVSYRQDVEADDALDF